MTKQYEKIIYNHVKKVGITDIHTVAEKLKIEEVIVLKCFNELQDKGFLEISDVPLLDGPDGNNGPYYRCTKRIYKD